MLPSKQLRERVDVLLEGKFTRVSRSAKFVQIVLVLGGALCAGIAAIFPIEIVWPPTAPQTFGVAGAALAFIGGCYFATTADDSTQALLEASRATEMVTRLEEENREFFDYLEKYHAALGSLKSLYAVHIAARSAMEQAITNPARNDVDLINTCLTLVKRDLRIALQFEHDDIWTICIYKAIPHPSEARRQLKLVAHHRSVDCDVEHARLWDEGVGVGGIALAKNDEVMVPNLDAPEVGTTFRLEGDWFRDTDKQRYKSICAVPINIGEGGAVWGVAMATSNREGHFGSNGPGVASEEPVRMLAGIVALAVSVSNATIKSVQSANEQTS